MTTDYASYYPASVDLTFTMTTPEQETELFVKARAGDFEAREFLIENHMLFAATYARRLSKRRLPDAEVIGGANLALMKAFNGFDPRYGSRFTSYLKPFIQGEVSALWKRHFRNLLVINESDLDPSQECPIESPEGSPHVGRADAEHSARLLEILEECREVLNEREQEAICRRHLLVDKGTTVHAEHALRLVVHHRPADGIETGLLIHRENPTMRVGDIGSTNVVVPIWQGQF